MERPKREKVLTAADLKRKADRDALKAAREGKKSRLDSLVVGAWGVPALHCVWRARVCASSHPNLPHLNKTPPTYLYIADRGRGARVRRVGRGPVRGAGPHAPAAGGLRRR